MADDLVLPMAELKLDSTPVNSSPITLVSRHEEAEGGLTVTDDSKGDSDEEGDIIILHTADDVAILASFDILAKYSPFFATLRDLPRPDGTKESVIPLPSASSTGLALVISVLEDLNATSAADAGATVAGGGTEVDWTTVSEADLAHVTAAMEVADAYDIPAFTSYYIDKVHKAMDKNPSLAFTMAALGKDQQKAKQSARDILRPWHRLSTGMTALLQEHAPEYLDALRTFISRYDRAHTKFLADLRSNETMENGFNDYGQMCKRDYHGCVTHDRYKSFRKMRVAYANQEFHKLVDIAFSESHWYHVNVGC